MQTILVIVHLFLAMGLIGLILIQHGKGADAGAAFGSGASATVFGASGSANFLSRATGVLALLFFVTSLALAWFSMNTGKDEGLMIESVAPAAVETGVPAAVTTVTSDVPELPVAAPESDVPAPAEEQAAEAPAPAAEQ
jgi:preprotein translocase subunit SecG